MARRRINTKFLGIIFAALIVAAVALLLVKKFFVKENPQPFIAQGEAAARAGDWRTAAADFGHAAALLPQDFRVSVMYGNALWHLGADDPEQIRAAAGAWRHAVEVNPDYKEAWQALLQAYQTDLQRLESMAKNDRMHDTLAQYFTLIRDTANELVRLDPKDERNLSIIPELNIRLWLMDISLPLSDAETALPYDKRPTDDQKINTAITDLTHHLTKDAGDSQAAWWIARAKLHQAQLLFQKDQTTDAETLLSEAGNTFDDPILLKPANVVELYVGQAQILGILQQIDPRVELRADYAKRVHQAWDKAQAAVDPKNAQQYNTIKLAWAHDVATTDPGRAEKIYNDIIAKNPSDISSKVELAMMLKNDATRRGDALAILNQIPDSPPPGLSDARREEMKVRILQVKMLRAEILSAQMASTQDPGEKDRLGTQIQKIIDGLATSNIDKWRILKLQGKLQLQKGQYRDAIQTLTGANDQLATTTGQKDSELLLLLAESERLGQQTGNAIAMLNEALKDPNVARTAAPHMELAQLYMLNRDIEKAKPQVDWMAVRFPDAPEVIRFQIRCLNPTTDHDAIAKLYQKLPETNKAEMAQKLQMAHELNDAADGERLLRAMHAADPDDVTVTYQLGMVLVGNNHSDEAKKMVADALAAKPKDPTLILLSDAVNGSSADEVSKAVRDQVNAISDPYTKAIKLADLARLQGNKDEELVHLKEASAAQPKNTMVLERTFLWYIGASQFDNADKLVPQLAALDADQAHGQLYRFRLAMARSDLQTALAIGRQLTVDFKEFSESWESLGEALQASGQLESASTKYLEALNKQSNNIKALRNLIACSYMLGKIDNAKRYLDDASQRFPNDPDYKKLEVEHELRYGDPESVLDSVRQDLVNSPDNAQVYRSVASALLRAAAIKFAKGDPTTAKAHIDEARQDLQKGVTRWPDSILLVSDLANACVQAGDIPAGEAAIKALADRPKWKDSPSAAVALADFYVLTRRLNLAEAPLRDALAKTNNNPDVEIKLAQVLIDEQKYQPALEVLKEHQDLLSIRKMRTEVLLSTNNGAQAETEIQDALKANPSDRDLTKLLLFIYYGQGKNDQVRKLATDCIATDQSNLPAYYYRALSNMQGQHPDTDSAINDLTYVRDQTAENLEARLALANARVQKGDTAGAITELEAALRAFPQNKQTRLRLIELYEVVSPPRWLDAEQTVTDGLALPQFANDVELLRAAAVMWARRGEPDKAVTNIRAAMAQVTDKSPLIHDYLTVLLLAKQYDLIIKESDPIVAAPNAPWWVYGFRGQARAKTDDVDGAKKEFDTALNIAGTSKTHAVASAVVRDIVSALGVGPTLDFILPRTKNSTSWKLVALPLYDQKGDRVSGLKMAEEALPSVDTLPPQEQDELYGMTASLYLTSNPPQIPKAVALYKQMLVRHPNDYLSMNNLACILDDANPPQATEALVYSTKAFEAVKATGHIQPLIYDTQGWTLILAGQPDEGIDVLHQAIDQSDFPDAHYHLAEGYLKKARPEDAVRELTSASDLIDKANAAKRPVDPLLAGKIDDAQKRAQKMTSDKTQAVAP